MKSEILRCLDGRTDTCYYPAIRSVLHERLNATSYNLELDKYESSLFQMKSEANLYLKPSIIHVPTLSWSRFASDRHLRC